MFQWTAHEPEQKIVDALGLTVEKDVTLQEAAQAYMDKDVYKFIKNYLLEAIDGKRKIGSILIRDGLDAFNKTLKKRNRVAADRVRRALAKIIYFSVKGESNLYNKIQPEENAENSNGDIGKLVFKKAKFDDITHLIPRYTFSGRFGQIKADVQSLIYSLGAGESGYVAVPNRKSMDAKEAKAICTTIKAMFKKGNFPWMITYNPTESVFLIMRKSDFENWKNAKHEEKKHDNKNSLAATL